MDDTMDIKTKDARAHAGGVVALAKIFGILHNSVSQWGENLPEARTHELRQKRPQWFFKNGKLKPPPADAVADARFNPRK